MKKEVWAEIYDLCIQGFPAKKICSITRRDKAQVSRMIKALESSGFLLCVNAGDKVKFYRATKKPLTPDDKSQLSTILQKKTKKTDDRGSSSLSCHAISFQAKIISMDSIKWDKTWKSKGVSFYLYQYPFENIGSISFVRIKGKSSDILKINLPRFTWDVRKGSPEPYLKEIALLAVDWFHKRFNLSFSDFKRCSGGHFEIPVTDPDLVKIAQYSTVKLGDYTLDSSMGFAEFGSTKGYDKMEELFSLIPRVAKLEQEMVILTKAITTLIPQVEKLSPEIQKLSKQVEELLKMFSQPKIPDSFKDVT
jgi:hypothetical protein